MSNKVLIIAGMHRSGTSVISQWLYRCGISLGEKLLGSDIGNTEGHYEDEEFIQLHEKILQLHGLPDTGLTYREVLPLSAAERQDMMRLVAKKNAQLSQWAWKDPRGCLFLPVYKSIIPDAFYLVVVRPYKDVVNSLIIRDFQHALKKENKQGWVKRWLKKSKPVAPLHTFYQQKAEEYLKVWIAYNTKLLIHLHSIAENKYLVVNYEFLLDHDYEIAYQIQRKWGFAMEFKGFKNVFKPSLITAHTAIETYVIDRSLIETANQIYAEFNKFLLFPYQLQKAKENAY